MMVLFLLQTLIRPARPLLAPLRRRAATVVRDAAPQQLDAATQARIRRAGADKAKAPLRMPSRLSPTAATTFLECEQLFLFRNLWRLPEPPSPALVRGSLVHSVLEHMFDGQKRSKEELQDAFRDEWRSVRDKYLGTQPPLFTSIEEEKTWGTESLGLLENYLRFETPDDETLVEREAWLEATAKVPSSLPPLKVVGKVDRVDREDDGSLRVVDYKTGQAACERPYYKEELRNELRERALFQLRVYAWMLSRRDGGADVSALRLLYLGGEKAVAVDEALPSDPKDRRKALEDTERELVDIWKRIRAKVDQGALSFESCDRKWCFCHAARPLCFPASDDAPASDDLSSKSVKDLRELCRARGLDSVVKRGQDVRATLTARLSGG